MISHLIREPNPNWDIRVQSYGTEVWFGWKNLENGCEEIVVLTPEEALGIAESLERHAVQARKILERK